MSKIIVEHVKKKPKARLNAFVDGVKVGDFRYGKPLEVDVPRGGGAYLACLF